MPQKLQTLDSALRFTTSRRWISHHEYLPSRETGPTPLRLKFGDQHQRLRSRFNAHRRPQKHLEYCYGAWKLWSVYLQEPIAEHRYIEIGPQHVNMVSTTEIAQSCPRRMALNAKRAKFTVWSQSLPTYAEGQYHDEGPFCDIAVALVVSKHKS